MDSSSAQKSPYIYKCSSIKKYGTVRILEVDDMTAD